MSLRTSLSAALLLAVCGLAGTVLAIHLTTIVQAAPIDGQVISGTAAISQSGTTTTIQQSSQNLSLTWKGFNIAAQETVNFQQPSASAIAVNRIFDINGTKIFGHLNANGQVYLINPNGVLFGRGAQVNVGGLVASSLDLNETTLNSNVRSFSGTGKGSIVNQGTINAANGGSVALLGNEVSNQGVITAQLGSVALGAGSAATLTFNGNTLVDMQIDQSTLDNLAENRQLIRADGGQVLMTAGAKHALLASVVNNTGVVEARTVENRNGTIVLLGGMEAGQTNVAGKLDASAPNGGDGGFIETSAAHVNIADDARITTAATNGEAGTWLIDPVDFTIAAAGGDMTGATLSTNLGLGNVSILSTSGATGTAGDVNVNDTVTWSANQLTLNAQNNININADMTASATASLALEYGQGALAAGNSSDVVTTGAVVNLPAGTANFTTKQGSDGTVKNYTVITTLGAAGSTTTTDLQGMSGGLALNYALGSNIDASSTSGWNAGAGFLPVGDFTTGFTGTFDGLGHSISGLTINRTSGIPVGLFGAADAGSEIRNIGMVGGSASGVNYVAGLVGRTSSSTIMNSYATGSASGSWWVGGLVGYQSSSTISDSYATGAVTGTVQNIGGLVGEQTGSTISNSYAEGNVIGAEDTGGLVGDQDTSTISGSYATGDVSGVDFVGGLVGFQSSSTTITSSYATGNVSGTSDNVGGLVGAHNSGSIISASYAEGNATGVGNVGGLVGDQSGSTISDSYATGTVTGTNDDVGGLVGEQRSGSAITTSYATGNVSGGVDDVGGLVGNQSGSTITESYATGNASSSDDRAGGLVGNQASNSTITDSYATGIVSSGDDEAGGLVGQQTGSTISGSYATGDVSSVGDNSGGLVGKQISNSTITDSYAEGAVSGFDDTGGLVGDQNGSSISGSYATGDVTGADDRTGGLVGIQKSSSSISDSYATGMVSGTDESTGGLVGIQTGGSTITDSYATGNVSGFDETGGLVGEQDGSTITDSYATGNVTGADNNTGGLVGYQISSGTISGSYATGNVTGVDEDTGGLVGEQNNSSLTTSYATGAVSGNDWVGGLVGYQTTGTISSSYATGSVSATTDNAGGLVGEQRTGSAITTSYATGAVSGRSEIGGLVGDQNGSTISNSYAGGSVSGSGSSIGGLVGIQQNIVTISDSFWDITTSGQAASAGEGAGAATGMVTAEMKAQANFTSATTANGSANPDWDFTDTWVMTEGFTYPRLQSLTTLLTVTADNDAKIYNAVPYSGGNGVTYSGFVDSDSASALGGSLAYGGTSQGAVNAGSYAIAPSGYTSGKYLFSYSNGTLTVDTAPLTMSGITASNKVYDGTTIAAVTTAGALYTGLITGDAVTVSATGAFVDAAVGTGKVVTLTSSYTGLDVSNYNITDQFIAMADITGIATASLAPQSANNAIAQVNAQPDRDNNCLPGYPWPRCAAQYRLFSPFLVIYHSDSNHGTEDINAAGSSVTLIIHE